MNKFIGDRHVLTLSGQNRQVTRSDILRFAEQGDIRNASSILEEITDAVNAFPEVAAEIGIDSSVCSLINEHIKSYIPAGEYPGAK